VAEQDGVPVGTALLFTHKRVGVLLGGAVVPAARGRGVQRALISARARAAIDQGCDLLTSQADVDSVSERNLRTLGFERIWQYEVYPFDPAHDPAPGLTERDRSARVRHTTKAAMAPDAAPHT
jgi:GNAT superfamily N-acetyltransferase